MSQFSEGQTVKYNGSDYTVTKVTEPATETTYELTPLPVTPTPLEGIPESAISGE